jgi:cytochrome c553
MRFFQPRAALLLAGLPVVVALSACTQAPPSETVAEAPAAVPAETPAERGAVLVQVGGCHDCHTNKVNGAPDMSNKLAGHPQDVKITELYKPAAGTPWTIATNDTLTAWSGPWGISFAANLTPDADTGLRASAWSEEAFLRAMKTGKHIGTGRDILPPMPWFMYAELSDEDLKAIWAYLMTLPPIKNEVADPIPPAQ